MLDNFRTQNIMWDRANEQIRKIVNANSGDENGRKLSVQIINNNVVEDLTGATVSLSWKTKSGSHIGLDAFKAIDATKGIYEMFYTTAMLSNEGVLRASLVLVDDIGTVESNAFAITVNQSNVDAAAVQSENSFTALTTALVEVNGWNGRIDTVEQDFKDRADAMEVQYPIRLNDLDVQFAQTIKKGEASVYDIDRNLGKLDETYMTDTFLSNIAGTTPISSTFADKSVTFDKTDFLEIYYDNLIDKSQLTDGYLSATGQPVVSTSATLSGFIPIVFNETYRLPTGSYRSIDSVWSGHIYDENKNDLGKYGASADYIYTATNPSGAFMRVVWVKNPISDLESMMFVGTKYSGDYVPHVAKVRTTQSALQDLLDKTPDKSINPEKTTFFKVEHTNHIDKSKIIPNRYITDTGVLASTTASTVSGLIKVETGKTYTLPNKYVSESDTSVWSSYAYDEQGLPIGRIAPTINKLTIANIGTEVVGFIRINWFHSDKILVDLDLMMFEGDINYPTEYIPYVVEELGFIDEKAKEVFARKLSPYILPLDEGMLNLKWAVIGDSITAPTTAYHNYVAEKLGLHVLNYGIGGSRISTDGDSYPMSTRYVDMDDTADIITVLGGTNDNACPIGVMEDRVTTTFYGACHVLFKGLVEKYPGKRIGIMTPTPKVWLGDHMNQRVEAEKEVAHYYGIPVLDLFNESGMAVQSLPIKDLLMPDGLHPSVAGHQVLARPIEHFIGRI